MKTFVILMAFVFSIHSQAATFKKISALKDRDLNAYAKEAAGIVLSEAFSSAIAWGSGDVNSVTMTSFTRKSTETDLNTVKQYDYRYAGIMAGDEEGASEINVTSAISDLFSQVSESDFGDEEGAVLSKGKKDLTKALIARARLASKTFKYFSTVHSFEDGTYSVLNILDTKNNQLLTIIIGASGT